MWYTIPRPQAHDTEPLDLEKRPGKKTHQKYLSTVIGTITSAGYFRDFPQELNFNFLMHDTTHLQEHISEKIVW